MIDGFFPCMVHIFIDVTLFDMINITSWSFLAYSQCDVRSSCGRLIGIQVNCALTPLYITDYNVCQTLFSVADFFCFIFAP